MKLRKFTKLLAFTLAETLIVMAVIGIVSALTLPNLNSSTGDKERVAKVKKIYQNLNDALGRAEAVYGPYCAWFVNDGNSVGDDAANSKRGGERITEFMKLSKDCKQVANSGCFTTGNVKNFNGTASSENYDSDSYSYKVITADGTSISFSVDPAHKQLNISIDIDGPSKGAYTYGKDVFLFQADASFNVMPEGYNETFAGIIEEFVTRGCGNKAAAWIINYDNADYLQIQSVSGSTATCKNGNTMTESHPRCK